MSEAFRSFPNGGKLYKDKAGRLTASFRDESGLLHRKRVKTEEAGRVWLDQFVHGETVQPSRPETPQTDEPLEALSLPQMKDALAALNILRKAAPGTSLVEAVQSFIASGAGSPTLADAVQAFLKQKSANPATLRNYRIQGRKLCRAFPDRRIEDLDPYKVEDIVQKHETSAFRPFVAQLSTFALNNGWIKEPLVERATSPKQESKPRTILSVEEVGAVLSYVGFQKHSLLLPVVFQLFCGLRPTSALAFTEDFFNPSPHEMGFHYPPPIYGADALHAWFRFASGLPKTTKREWDKSSLSRVTTQTLGMLGIKIDGAEVLRHTGNAYRWHKACAEGKAEEAAQAMHLTPQLCREYYGGPDETIAREADRFFEITPAKLGLPSRQQKAPKERN